MVSSYARRADYSKICSDCDNYEKSATKAHFCHAQRDLITGRPVVTSCSTQRAMSGACGPDGLRFVAVEDIQKKRAAE